MLLVESMAFAEGCRREHGAETGFTVVGPDAVLLQLVEVAEYLFAERVGELLLSVEGVELRDVEGHIATLLVVFSEEVEHFFGEIGEHHLTGQTGNIEQEYTSWVERRRLTVATPDCHLHRHEESILEPDIPLEVSVEINVVERRRGSDPQEPVLFIVASFIQIVQIDCDEQAGENEGEEGDDKQHSDELYEGGQEGLT